MPSPVSPDAGVPEHQPDPYRQNRRPQSGAQPRQAPNGPPPHGGRPQSGQFPAGQPLPGRQPGQFGSGQPLPGRQPGQFGARPQSGQLPTRGDDGAAPDRKDKSKSSGRDRIWSVVAFLVAAGVITAVAFYFFGPDGGEDTGATWAVDSCAGPDAASEGADPATATYRPLACDDPGATVTILDIQDAVSVAQMHCPAGTDVVFQKDGQAGGNTQAVCARNLSDDHPGDPGMGGGQLMADDCVDEAGAEVPCASGGARKVVALILEANDCPEGTRDQLDLGFDAERSYETICLGD